MQRVFARLIFAKDGGDGIEAELLTFVPFGLGEMLSDGIHDVDGVVEVRLLFEQIAEALDGHGLERRVVCAPSRPFPRRRPREGEGAPLTSFSQISRKRR